MHALPFLRPSGAVSVCGADPVVPLRSTTEEAEGNSGGWLKGEQANFQRPSGPPITTFALMLALMGRCPGLKYVAPSAQKKLRPVSQSRQLFGCVCPGIQQHRGCKRSIVRLRFATFYGRSPPSTYSQRNRGTWRFLLPRCAWTMGGSQPAAGGSAGRADRHAGLLFLLPSPVHKQRAIRLSMGMAGMVRGKSGTLQNRPVYLAFPRLVSSGKNQRRKKGSVECRADFHRDRGIALPPLGTLPATAHGACGIPDPHLWLGLFPVGQTSRANHSVPVRFHDFHHPVRGPRTGNIPTAVRCYRHGFLPCRHRRNRHPDSRHLHHRDRWQLQLRDRRRLQRNQILDRDDDADGGLRSSPRRTGFGRNSSFWRFRRSSPS